MSEAAAPSLAVLRNIVLLGLQLRQVGVGTIMEVQGAKEVEMRVSRISCFSAD